MMMMGGDACSPSLVAELCARIAESQTVTVFLSSPFGGMEEERVTFIEQYLPMLKGICEARGVHLAICDLRWGITEDQSARNETLLVCLQEIDDADIFIGLYGRRYGSYHNPNDQTTAWVKDCFDVAARYYPFVSDYSDRSITELEFIHGFINDPEKRPSMVSFRDFVYDADMEETLRQHDEAERELNKYAHPGPDAMAKLSALIETTRALGEAHADCISVNDYRTPKEGAKQVFFYLRALLRHVFRKMDRSNMGLLWMMPSQSPPMLQSPVLEPLQPETASAPCSAMSSTTAVGRPNDLSFVRKLLLTNIGFALVRQHACFGMDGLLSDVVGLLNEQTTASTFSTAVAITGPVGSGKSTIVSTLWKRLRNGNPVNPGESEGGAEDERLALHVICHFVGCSSNSTLLQDVLISLLCQLHPHEHLGTMSTRELYTRFRSVIEQEYGQPAAFASRTTSREASKALDAAEGQNKKQNSSDVSQQQGFVKHHSHRSSNKQRPRKLVILIDAVDKLENEIFPWLPGLKVHELQWLLMGFANVTPVFSFSSDASSFAATIAAMPVPPRTIGIPSLGKPHRRQVVSFAMKRASKTLQPALVEQIVSNESTGNPLFLVMLLEELVKFGQFAFLAKKVAELCRCTTITELVTLILSRIEHNFRHIDAPLTSNIVQSSLQYIACARNGMIPGLEVRDLLGLQHQRHNLLWSSLLHNIKPLLTVHMGKYTFAHEYIVAAVRRRYNLVDSHALWEGAVIDPGSPLAQQPPIGVEEVSVKVCDDDGSDVKSTELGGDDPKTVPGPEATTLAVHARLAAYFLGRDASVSSNHTHLQQSPLVDREVRRLRTVGVLRGLKLAVDEATRGRVVNELPFHLSICRDTARLYDALSTLQFLHAKAQAGLGRELLLDLRHSMRLLGHGYLNDQTAFVKANLTNVIFGKTTLLQSALFLPQSSPLYCDAARHIASLNSNHCRDLQGNQRSILLPQTGEKLGTPAREAAPSSSTPAKAATSAVRPNPTTTNAKLPTASRNSVRDASPLGSLSLDHARFHPDKSLILDTSLDLLQPDTMMPRATHDVHSLASTENKEFHEVLFGWKNLPQSDDVCAQQTLSGHESRVTSTSFAEGTSYLLSSSSDKSLILWDIDAQEELKRFKGHSKQVSCCLLLGKECFREHQPLASYMLTQQSASDADVSVSLQLYSEHDRLGPEAMEDTETIPDEDDLEQSKEVDDKAGMQAHAGLFDGATRMAGLPCVAQGVHDEGEPPSQSVHQQQNQQAQLESLEAFDPLALHAGTIKISAHKGTPPRPATIPAHHPTQGRAEEGDLRLRTGATSSANPPCSVREHAPPLPCPSYESLIAISGSKDRTLRLWDVQTGASETLYRNEGGGITCMALLKAPAHRLVVGTGDKKVIVLGFKLHGKSLVPSHHMGAGARVTETVLQGHLGSVRDVACAVTAPIIVSCDEISLWVWNAVKGRKLAYIDQLTSVTCCCVSPTASWLAFASYKTVLVRNLRVFPAAASVKFRGQCVSHKSAVKALTCIDEDTIASGSEDATIKVWDISSPACPSPGSVTSVTTNDSSASLQEAAPLQFPCLATIEGHTRSVTSLSSPHNLLVSGSKDQSIRFLYLHEAAWIRQTTAHDSSLAMPSAMTGELGSPLHSGVVEGLQLFDSRPDAACEGTFCNAACAHEEPCSPFFAHREQPLPLAAKGPKPSSQSPTAVPYRAHENVIHGCALSEDVVVTVSVDGKARVWDRTSYTLRGQYLGHSGWVLCVALASPISLVKRARGQAHKAGEKSIAVTGGHDTSICVFDVSSAGLDTMVRLFGHHDDVTCVDARIGGPASQETATSSRSPESPSTLVVASGSTDSTVRLWLLDTKTVALQRSRCGRSDDVNSDGDAISSTALHWVSRAHKAFVQAVSLLSSDSSMTSSTWLQKLLVVSADCTGTMCVTSAASGAVLLSSSLAHATSIPPVPVPYKDAALRRCSEPQCRRLASCIHSEPSLHKVTSLASQMQRNTHHSSPFLQTRSDGPPESHHMRNESHTAAALSSSQNSLLNLASNGAAKTAALTPLSSFSLSTSGTRFAVGHRNGNVELWCFPRLVVVDEDSPDVSSLVSVDKRPSSPNPTKRAKMLGMHVDDALRYEKEDATSRKAGKCNAYDSAIPLAEETVSDTERGLIQGESAHGTCLWIGNHTDEVTGLEFTGNDHVLVSISRDTSIKIWKVADGDCLARMTASARPLRCIAAAFSLTTIEEGRKQRLAGLDHVHCRDDDDDDDTSPPKTLQISLELFVGDNGGNLAQLSSAIPIVINTSSSGR